MTLNPRGEHYRGAHRAARWICSAVLLLVMAATPAFAMDECPAEADALVEAGWEEFRAGRMDAAGARFEEARRACPESIGARTGLGYVALRRDRLEQSRTWFRQVVDADAAAVDAWVGLGLIAWREGDLREAHDVFTRVQRLDPSRPEAREYLARIPAGFGAPPARPPLVLPDTTVYPARTHGDRFEVRTAGGWEPFYIKGVNLGAALPGRHPSEFPDSAVYAGWIEQMGEMGANAIRLYTIHPPHFYQALYAYNTANPDALLWIIHGVWTELPPEHDYEDPAWEGEFFAEMRSVVDVIHGRADITPRPGHASGHYTADVSSWTLAYIIGREWEPYSVVAYNQRHPSTSGWDGRYLRVEGGTAMDAWMGKACEEMISYEMETYRTQRPIAYTNWPTLDPLHHPTETTVDEEVGIRTALGEDVGRRPLEYDNDAVGLDAMLVRATGAFPAGYFASFHPYPYYPDFMVLDPEYSRTRSPYGPSNYYGYLRRLKDHHPGMPVVVAEYGVPASLATAHLQPQGWHHGGHGEAEMARINERLTREIAEAGMAGGAIFAWIDEWFKKNWLVIDFEIPLERNRLWLNRLDPEQLYGVLALEAEPPVPGAALRDRLAGWQEIAPLYAAPDGSRLRAAVDEAHLWLLFEPGEAGGADEELLVGFDLVDPAAGNFMWPGGAGDRLPVGLEFVLQVKDGEARLLADPRSNPWKVREVGQNLEGRPLVVPAIADPPPGFFYGRYQQQFNRPYVTLPRSDGVYEPLRVVTNRRRFGRDSTEYAALGYDRGILLPGTAPDGNWERLDGSGVIEVRIPWNLLNFTDPSQRRILQDPSTGDLPDHLGTVTVDAIRIVAARRKSGGSWQTWPASASREDVASFTWPAWEEPRWRVRRRPLFDSLRRTFGSMQPPALQSR